jgi:hypothetical protein
VNDDESPYRRADAEEDEAMLIFRVFWVIEQARMGIVENTLGFFKPNSMLGPIAPVFPFVPV